MEILKREHRPTTIDHSHFIILQPVRAYLGLLGVDSVQSTGHDESAYLEVAIKLIERKRELVNFLSSSFIPFPSPRHDHFDLVANLSLCVAEFA